MEGEMSNSITEERKEQKIDVNISIFEERKEFKIDVNENLELHSECCIYRVPKALRKLNEEAYTPKVISIGPLHHGKEEFADMEKQKIRYKREFRKRITTEKWREILNFIEVNEGRIRNCYAERPMLQKHDFITMILYDAVFIIELFLRFSPEKNLHGDFLLDISRMQGDIRADLQLLENQLPFYVLNDIYNLACHNAGCKPSSFFSLSFQFFYLCKPDEVPSRVELDKHFTDLSRYFLKKKHPEPSGKKHFRELPCAVKLQESGVKFNKKIKGECVLDVTYSKNRQRIPCLKGDDELQIPRFEIDDCTERLFRNVMALEQCHYPKETFVCNYVDLMDILIETEEDVNLLVESGIISNNLGDSATVARMFNKLCLEITSSPSIYGKISEELRAHYDDRWNHAKATLKMVYFSNLWRGTATVAAVVLLFLTLIQTIFSILSVV